MGIGSALTLLAFSRHPSAQLLNKHSLLMVMTINLVMGFAIEGINNASHIGGALTGGALGLAAYSFKYWLVVLMCASLFVLLWWYLFMQITPYL